MITLADGTLRYVTLEKAFDLFGERGDRTILGGWDDDGGHLNFGEGPKPTVEEFEKHVRTLINEPAEPQRTQVSSRPASAAPAEEKPTGEQ